ncbi:MAG TPA: DUF4157 domain-containing protein [Puia sp.]|nr:DUF4157 domain-containing protein [Puia sp.]
MKSAEVKPATTAKNGPGKPFFTGAGEAMQEQEQRPAFFNYGNPVQTKLSIGKAGDHFEQEADATADKVVMRLADHNVSTDKKKNAESAAPGVQTSPATWSPLQSNVAPPVNIASSPTSLTAPPQSRTNGTGPSSASHRGMAAAPPVQTKCAACEEKERQEREKESPERDKIRKKPIFDSNAEPTPPPMDAPAAGKMDIGVQRCEACEREQQQQGQQPVVQKSGPGSEEDAASPGIESGLRSSKGGGSPLPSDTREKMESSFGADFSGVRIHTDGQAAAMNERLNAHAFAHGNDIYFNSGKYDTQSKDGQRLLAHELTHTVQQGASVRKQAAPAVQKDDDDNSSWWDSVKSFGSSVASGVSDLASDVKSGVVGAASYVSDKVTDAASYVKDRFNDLVNWVRGLINEARDYIVGTWEFIKSFASGAVESIKQTYNGLVAFFKSPLTNIANALENLDPAAVNLAWMSFLAFVEGKWASFKAVGQTVLQQVYSFWDGISGYVDRFFNRIDNIMQGTVYRQLPDFVQSIVETAYDGFKLAWHGVEAEWNTVYGSLSGVVNGFFRLGDEFLEKLRAIPVAKIVDFLHKFGAFIKRVIEIWHNPHILIDPFVKWLVDKLKDAPQKFLAEIEKQMARNKDKRKAANQGKMPKRYSLEDQDIALGVVRACIHKWQQMDIGSMLKDMVLSMVWPPATARAIGEAWDGMKKDIKEVWDRLYKVETLQDFWTNLLHLLDIIVIIWRFLNTVVGLLYVYLAILLIIAGGVLGGVFGVGAGAVPGMIAGAELAGEIGEVLLVSFLAGEATNLGLQYVILATGVNTEEEQETAFNKIADSVIGLVTAGILAILSAIAARIASGIMTAAKALLSKLSELLGDAAEDVKGKPGEGHTGGPEDKGGTGEKGGTDEKGGAGDKGTGDKGGAEDKTGTDEKRSDASKDVDPNTVQEGEAPLEKPLKGSADGKRQLAMDIDGDCEVCPMACSKLEKEYGSYMDDETRARIDKVEKSNLSNEKKLEKLSEIEQSLRDKLGHLDKEGKLKPDQQYRMAGEYGYPAESDHLGRLSRVHTDDLKLSKFERVEHEPNTPGKLDGDHAGHILGDRFGGSPELDNLVSQEGNRVNLSEYKKLENQWAKELKKVPPSKVEVDVKINYDGDSDRPASFDVHWKVNGKPFNAFIKN